MNIEKDLKAELDAVSTDLVRGMYSDANQVKSMVRAIASSYGLGVGYIYARLFDLVEHKKQVA